MKKTLRAGFAATLIALPVLAQAAPEPEFTFSGNAGLFSDYRFRGFTQTDYKPAFQGGFDLAHKSGFYVGNWNSNVSSVAYSGASLEMDFYGGYKMSLGDIGLDFGAIYYYYPGTGKTSGSYSGLDAAQMNRLKTEFGIYGLDTGRICVAALNSRNLPVVARAMATVLRG